MPSTLDLTETPGLFALFKGDSGSGKSTGAHSFPGIYSFDFDKKQPSIALKHFPGKEIHWDTFNDIFQVQSKIDDLLGYCPYETILADSFTALTNLVISSVGQVKGDSVPDLLRKVQKTKTGASQIEMMGIDYYSAEDRFCVYFLEQLKKLWARPGNPRHVIVTAHILTVDSAPDLKTKTVTRTRSIVSKGRKVAAWLPTEFDNVYIFGHEQPDMGELNPKIKRIMKTETFDEDSGKCSFPFPGTINFTNKSLFDELCKYQKGWKPSTME